MARWQLTEPHYLNVPGTKWEMQITDRVTGRPKRTVFNVPLHLDPNIESDWNYTDRIGNNIADGKIIVCHEGKGEDRDIIFIGDPTPGMLPIDDEAREISARFPWKPTQGLDEASQAESFQQQLLVSLSNMKDQVSAAPKVEGMSELMKAMADMMKMQSELLGALTGKKVEAPLSPTQSEATAEAKARPAHQAGIDLARRLSRQAAAEA